MSIIIKNMNGETFDLPSGYVIESTRTNPLFTKKGPQTVPVSFPATSRNRRLTEYAARLDNASRPSATVRVIIESGAMQQTGLLAINTASQKTISANIGWDESEMYASMNKTLLPDLPDLPVYDPGGADLDARRNAMLTHLRNVMNGIVETDYAIFPLVLKIDTAGENEQPYLEMLNDTFTTSKEEFGLSIQQNGEIGGFRAKKDRIIQRIHNGQAIPFDAPKCYGLSPFLRIWKVLELIFANYGFTLENNPFYAHDQLRKLVVLNNTMDSVITGRLSYKDLMPDVTVESFLDALNKKFGMLYYVNSNTRTVKIQFIRDVIDPSNRDGLVDLSRYKSSSPSITYKENKQLKLTGNNEIEGTAPVTDSFDDFLASVNYQFFDSNNYLEMDWNPRYSLVFTAWRRLYKFYERLNFKSSMKLSTDFFNWDKKDDIAYEEIKFTDINLPFLINIDSVDRFLFNIANRDTIPPTINFSCLILAYLVGYKNNYSVETVDAVMVEKEKQKAKLAFAFSWGKAGMDVNYTGSIYYDYAYASQDNRGHFGSFIINPSTGSRFDLSLNIQHDDGLYNRFWRPYDAFLRHSGHEVNINVKMSEFKLSSLALYQKIIIDNQIFIIEEIRTKTGAPAAIAELKLRTLRMYEPYKSQVIPTFLPQMYYWRPVSVVDWDYYAYFQTHGITNWTRHDISSVEFMLPPTPEQYAAGQTFVMNYQFEVRWRQNNIDQSRVINQVTTWHPTLIT